MSHTSQSIPTPIKINFSRIPLPILGGIIAIGSLLVILIFSLLAYQIYFLQRAHLGTRVGSVDVGGLNRFEVQQVVMAQASRMLNRQITIVGEDGTWTLTTAELGATVDVGHVVDEVFSVGRQGRFSRDLSVQFQTLEQPVTIQPQIHYDTGPTNTFLANLADHLNRPARDAQLFIEGSRQVTAISPEIGRTLDIEALRQAIQIAVYADQDVTIPLPMMTSQPRITEVEPTRSHIEALLSQPINFTFEDRNWTIEPEFIANLISLQSEIEAGGRGRIVARFDAAPLTAYFQTLAPEINREPINAWFDLGETTWTLTPIVESQDGLALDVSAAVALITDQIRQPNSHRLTLPVTVIRPAVPMDNPDGLGIKELVSTNTSYFKGSSKERIQNITVAASKFHGLVIPPGELFSFNRYLGEISPENGFAESLIIAGDRTAVGIGGGVCQVSTTAFRAAFYGGFELVERWAHGYRVSWYEIGADPGLDATIYSPLVDFKFRNDTHSYILIQTEVDEKAGTLTFNFYGVSAQREVIVSDPVETNVVRHGDPIYEEDPTMKPGEVKQVDWAVDGVDVTVNRTVKEGDQIIHQDTIFSRYRPWQAIYRTGPKNN